NLCNEYEGTIYYDRYIKGKWVRAEGACYRKFADNPKAYYCEIVNKYTDSNKKQFLTSQLEDITIGVDFGGNGSGHGFVATANVDNYKYLVALKSERHFGDYDSNDIDRLVLDFAQSVFDLYGDVYKVYFDNAETVLGRGLKRAFEKRFPNVIVRGARKDIVNDRIRCENRLIGSGRLYYTDGCKTLKEALQEAVWDSKKQEDIRLDDGTTDIDTLDAFEYTFERDMKRYIKAV
ncbi:MAG: PBSX family phage terminase large subunit, partial [Oscillospiraceae bacterium]|nr:PBSX family phage terminase large subunit [Oscillospiraceae bacterium]